MVTFSAPVFDISGPLVSLSGWADPKNIRRRATRVPVLDLAIGAVLVDGGYTPTDLIFNVSMPDSDGAHHLKLSGMIANYQSLVMSCSRGCYRVLVSNIAYDRGTTTATAEVLEDLS